MPETVETQIFYLDQDNLDMRLIEIAAAKLRAGGLVAFPTETVYGLGANAFDPDAVNRIFIAKGRPASDPIIVHIHELARLEEVAVRIPDLARQLAAKFWPGPLTMILERSEKIPPNVSAGLPTIAVRMPNHPVALALLQIADLPVAAPSANRFAHPSATLAAHVHDDLNGRVDIILDSGAANIGLESTILDLTKTPPVVLRPGGLTLETLREIIPDVQVLSKHLRADEAGIEAPGMLYKHYSPRARLLLFLGGGERVILAMRTRAKQLLADNKKIGILAVNDEQSEFDGLAAHFFLLGSTLPDISHNLFIGMRELDRLGVDVILVRGLDQSGLGAALWDRLLRAAEGHVINC